LKAIGTLRAQQGTILSLDASGIVKKILFKSGQDVRAGQTLLELQSADEREKLEALRASAELAKINYDRDHNEFKFHAISKATLQSDKYNWRNARALENGEHFLLEKKTLRAPFSGRLGIRLVDVGEYLTPGASVVELQSLHHILIDFMLPQRALSKLHVGDAIQAHIDAFPNKSFSGNIIAINSLVNSDTRNVEVRATLNNSQDLLLPGMFASIDISTANRKNYVFLPQTAIAYNSYGDTIYRIQKSKRGLIARQHFIVIGPTRGDEVAILSGVNAGEIVVTAGQIKLHNGATVVINNSVPPSSSLPRTSGKD
jgi:membrane fusion protein (multidrug efflux system)